MEEFIRVREYNDDMDTRTVTHYLDLYVRANEDHTAC